uniref:Fe2OG dioxygenase domain-containing protein n=1 Tax=Prasinoderma singulare TaxID=676789 RepID=A0A7S3BPN4_9VIRI
MLTGGAAANPSAAAKPAALARCGSSSRLSRALSRATSDINTRRLEQSLSLTNRRIDAANARAEASGEAWVPARSVARVSLSGVRGVADGEEVDADAARAAAASIGAAAKKTGFFKLVDTGIDAELYDEALRLTHAINDGSENIDFPVDFDPAAGSLIGFQANGRGSASRAVGRRTTGEPQTDLIQSFTIGPTDSARCERMHVSNMDNAWPTGCAAAEAFKNKITLLYSEIEALSRDVKALLAMSVGLDRKTFITPMANHAGLLRANYYPPCEKTDNAHGKFGSLGAHTDFGTVTLLVADADGLEVCEDGEWRRVVSDPADHAVNVNVADMMRQWTNDIFASGLHRVRMPGGNTASRASIAFFSDDIICKAPHFAETETPIEPLAELLEPGEEPHYAAEKWSAVLMRRYMRVVS